MVPHFNKQVFASYLVQHVSAKQFGEGRCAYHVRMALAAAGLKPIAWPEAAKDWGATLLALGFSAVPGAGYEPQLGDVIVIQPPKGEKPYGHIEGFNGKNWVSDFVQREIWPGPAYRSQKPNYIIYRYAH